MDFLYECKMPLQVFLQERGRRRLHACREDDVKMGTEKRVMWPQIKKCLEPPEAGRSQK